MNAEALLDLCPGPATQAHLLSVLGAPTRRLDNPHQPRELTLTLWLSGNETAAVAAIRACGDPETLAEIARRDTRIPALVAVAENPCTPMRTLRALPAMHRAWDVVDAASRALARRVGELAVADAVTMLLEVDVPPVVVTSVCRRADLTQPLIRKLLSAPARQRHAFASGLAERDDLADQPWLWKELIDAGDPPAAVAAKVAAKLPGDTTFLEALCEKAPTWTGRDVERHLAAAVRELAAWPAWEPAQVRALVSLGQVGTKVWDELATSPHIPVRELEKAPVSCLPAVLRCLTARHGDDLERLRAVLSWSERVMTVGDALDRAKKR